jgi:hypothetical protein
MNIVIANAIKIVNALPRNGGKVQWHRYVDKVFAIVSAILSAEDPENAMLMVCAGSKVSTESMVSIMRCRLGTCSPL